MFRVSWISVSQRAKERARISGSPIVKKKSLLINPRRGGTMAEFKLSESLELIRATTKLSEGEW